ncbi:CapA family protein [Candidatus Saccharibacteria bacterium]|nr:CapA family protein [Candidatus Saccharibacteria bacterium]
MESNDLRNRFKITRDDHESSSGQSLESPEIVIDEDIELPDMNTKNQPKKSKKNTNRKRFIFIIIGILVLFIGIFCYWRFFSVNNVAHNNNATQVQKPESSNKQQQKKTTVRLVATGDMIAHDTVLAEGKKADGTYDFSPMLANMKPFFDKSDVNFCNQATPAGGESFGYSGYPIFNAPIEWPRAIEGVGCNVINIGTNHTNDKGQGLVDATVAAWDGRPVLAVVGANRNAEEQAKIRYFEKDGVKFAIVAYSTYSNTPISNSFAINMYDAITAKTQISEARNNADVVIVSMRWGTEYSSDINTLQDNIAQELSDAGADVVLGHGPHVLEPVKKLKGLNGRDTYVWFSLGNFLNTQIETEALISGFAIMDIDVESKQIAEPKFMPIYMHYEWSAADKASNNLLARHNLAMYPLDQATEPISRSQLGTTVEEQTDRVTKLLNTYTPIKIIESNQY